ERILLLLPQRGSIQTKPEKVKCKCTRERNVYVASKNEREEYLMNTQSHPRPSARARELVRGAYDLHVHTSPDIMPRSASDLELAHRCRQWGLAGFVIKSHYVPTAERAALV